MLMLELRAAPRGLAPFGREEAAGFGGLLRSYSLLLQLQRDDLGHGQGGRLLDLEVLLAPQRGSGAAARRDELGCQDELPAHR